MSTEKAKKFQLDAARVAFDEKHRKTIRFNMGKYYAAVAKGKARYESFEATRDKAAAIKRHTLEHLSEYLQLVGTYCRRCNCIYHTDFSRKQRQIHCQK